MFNLQPVTPNMIIPNARERCPFNFPVQTRQHLLPHVNRVTGWVVDWFQSKANESMPKLFSYYQVAQNGWNNPIVVGVVSDALDLMDMLMASGKQMSDALMSAVDDMCNISVAKFTASNQQLFHSLPPELQRALGEWMNYDKMLAGKMMMFLQQSQQYAPQQMQQPMYQQPGGYGNAFAQPQAQQGGYYQPPAPASFGAHVPRGMSAPGSQAVSFNTVTSTNMGAPETGHRAFRTEIPTSVNYTPPVAAPVATPNVPVVETVYDRLDRGEMVQADAELFVPSDKHLLPLPLVFDLSKNVAFIEKAQSGALRYRLVSRESTDVKYEEHKNFHLLPQRSKSGPGGGRPNPLAADKAFTALMNLRAAEEAIGKFMDMQLEGTVKDSVAVLDSTIIDRVLETKNTNYREIAYGYFADNGVEIDSDSSLVAMHVVDIPAFGATKDVDVLYRGPYNASFNTNNPHREIAKAVQLLNGVVPDGTWEQLDKNLTDFINGRLRFMVGAESATIESYTDDIEDMVELIAQHIPEQLHIFNTAVVQQMRASCLNVDGDALAFTEEEASDESSATFFYLLQTVYLLPVYSRDITLGSMGGEAGLVSKTTNPDMHATLLHCMTNAHANARYVKFVTRDNGELYIYPGDVEANHYWLSRIKY